MYIVVERTILQHVSWINRDRLDNVNEGVLWKIDFYINKQYTYYSNLVYPRLSLSENVHERESDYYFSIVILSRGLPKYRYRLSLTD